MAQPVIEAKNIRKKFGNHVVIPELDLVVDRGEFLACLGPNGAGKSTLLRILALASRPSSGELRIEGSNAGEGEVNLRRRVGVISHNSFLYGNLTARENLEFYGCLYDVTDLKQRVQEVIGLVGLQYALSDPVRTFSRGMQQRLAIARALLHDPAIYFLDEPYTGLDQQGIDILNTLLKGLKARSRTVFLVTHNFDQGVDLSDRVLIMVRGRIVYHAPTVRPAAERMKEVYEQAVYQNLNSRQ